MLVLVLVLILRVLPLLLGWLVRMVGVVLVFGASKTEVLELYDAIRGAGILEAQVLMGMAKDCAQPRKGKITVLLAWRVDQVQDIKGVDFIIHYELPRGSTERAERERSANKTAVIVNMCPPRTTVLLSPLADMLVERGDRVSEWDKKIAELQNLVTIGKRLRTELVDTSNAKKETANCLRDSQLEIKHMQDQLETLHAEYEASLFQLEKTKNELRASNEKLVTMQEELSQLQKKRRECIALLREGMDD
ncbi:hypothetical protein Pelo_3331 [Pelomyxa schiedti]|nr:hypothetical protein Pelo_3331 [Pelomyxa schiedti]